MIRDEHYRAKLAHRGRGLNDLERTVGGVTADIDARLERQSVVRVLELGCGYGTALLELRARYGRRVELHGMNRQHGDGNPEILLRNARERGLDAEDPAGAVELPRIAYGDAARGLPFADASFDIVYSQVAWLYFGSKLKVINDVMRILRADGVARIDADEIRAALPAEYGRLVEIWDDGVLVSLADYMRRYGFGFVPAPEGEYLFFGKAIGFGDDLEPVFEIDVSSLHPHWDGVKCVYRRRAVRAPPRAEAAPAGPGT
jgi:SAM-dependent methyltransferase